MEFPSWKLNLLQEAKVAGTVSPSERTSATTASATAPPGTIVSPRSGGCYLMPTPLRGTSARSIPEKDLKIYPWSTTNGGCDDHEAAMRHLFEMYDTEGSGKISLKEFKTAFRNMEQFGVPISEKDIDRVFSLPSQLGGTDGHSLLSFNEFCVLMLKRINF